MTTSVRTRVLQIVAMLVVAGAIVLLVPSSPVAAGVLAVASLVVALDHRLRPQVADAASARPSDRIVVDLAGRRDRDRDVG